MARLVLEATEAGYPKVVSDLLSRGANMEAKNEVGETPFQIAARLPKTRKEEFEEYLEKVEKQKEIKPKETLDEVRKEAESESRNLANVFISQTLYNHEPTTISKHVFDMMNFVKKDHFKPDLLGDQQKFYANYDKTEKKETLLEATLNHGMVKEREDMLEVMKIVDLARYPDDQEEAGNRITRQVKKAVPSSVGLRDCIKSVSDKFPWSSGKLKFMTSVSFFIQVIMGTTFYGLDLYTDIDFSRQMYGNSMKNFAAELTQCQFKFEHYFEQAIQDCKIQFNKQACTEVLAVVKKTSEECFENEQRFTDNTDWRIAGAVCTAHCLLPFLVSFILWELIQVGLPCGWKSWYKMPVAFSTKWRKYTLEKKLYETYARADRNKNETTMKEYEMEKKKCLDKLEEHENIVVLSLVVESSIEASFQVMTVH